MVQPESSQSSPADTFITALQGGPEGVPELAVPTRLFEVEAVEPKTYMERSADGERLVMSDVNEEAAEEGDTDSAVDAEECLELEDSLQAAFWDRVGVLIKREDDIEAHVLEDDNENFEWRRGDSTLNFPAPPADWSAPPPKAESGEPAFSSVDNPGGWPAFSFRPKFTKGDKKKAALAKYSHHALPTGAKPVPKNASGECLLNGWTFEYGDWNPSVTADLGWNPVRSNSTRENPFPSERRSLLDYELLQNLGVKKQSIVNCNPLLFYQLILPFGDPKLNLLTNEKGEKVEDPRMPFYSEVE